MPHDVSWPDFTLMKVVCLMFLAFRNVFYNRDWVDFNSILSKVVVKSRNLGFWAQLFLKVRGMLTAAAAISSAVLRQTQ